MDCRNFDIHEFDNQEQLKAVQDQLGRILAPLSAEQVKEVKPMDNKGRKNYMRNQPCPCGIGTKFKKCCWSKYA